MAKAYEVNFDGLVGPTHNYAGLSFGNIASTKHKALISNPREAALQGLAKMKALHDLGLKQAVLPPQRRPDFQVLRNIGFTGTDEEVIGAAFAKAPEILVACYSAATMWTANAATIAPSSDTLDSKVHFTPANLSNKFHRSIEPTATASVFKSIFADTQVFTHHAPLPSGNYFGDEGAANHTRFCDGYGNPGIELFVYGRSGFSSAMKTAVKSPGKFPARQTREASEAIARLHALNADRVIFAQQNPAAIDAGAFHNDVVAVGNENVFFFHEAAFLNEKEMTSQLKRSFEKVSGKSLNLIRVKKNQVSLHDAVRSYLFNSQLVTLPSGKMALVAPQECSAIPSVKKYLKKLIEDASTPIQEILYFDLRQSMQNGGGPACLRLRVVLTETELQKLSANVLMSDELYKSLCVWVKKHYRDRLHQKDLADPQLAQDSQKAMNELSGILKINYD